MSNWNIIHLEKYECKTAHSINVCFKLHISLDKISICVEYYCYLRPHNLSTFIHTVCEIIVAHFLHYVTHYNNHVEFSKCLIRIRFWILVYSQNKYQHKKTFVAHNEGHKTDFFFCYAIIIVHK